MSPVQHIQHHNREQHGRLPAAPDIYTLVKTCIYLAEVLLKKYFSWHKINEIPIKLIYFWKIVRHANSCPLTRVLSFRISWRVGMWRQERTKERHGKNRVVSHTRGKLSKWFSTWLLVVWYISFKGKNVCVWAKSVIYRVIWNSMSSCTNF